MRGSVKDRPAVTAGTDLGHDGLYQVILFNDDYNVEDYVVQCLIRIFGHGFQLARKIMWEAHTTGRAIAEVEGGDEARTHCTQLRAAGLGSEVEKI